MRRTLRAHVGLLLLMTLAAAACGGPSAPAKGGGAQPAATSGAASGAKSGAASGGAKSGAATPAAKPVPLKVGFFGSINDAGLLIAEKRGYFSKAGLDVTLMHFPNAEHTITALGARQLDAAGISPTPGLFNGIQQGFDMRIVAGKGKIGPHHNFIGLIVRIHPQDIHSVAELKGKKVGVPALGTSTTAEFALLLKKHGMSLKDVHPETMTPPEMVVALKSGAIDAAIIQEPFITLAAEKKVATMLVPFGSLLPNGQNGVVAFGQHLLKDRALGQKFFCAYMHGIKDFDAAFPTGGAAPVGRSTVVKILTETTPVKNPALYSKMRIPLLNGKVDTASIQSMQRFFVQQRLQHTVLPPSAYLAHFSTAACGA